MLILPLKHPFNTIPHSSTSLASKSKPEVDIYGISVALACLPLSLQARASWRWIFMTFQHLRPPHHPHLYLPCIQDDKHACKPRLHQTYNLARLHSSVNWHSHCTCEVYWLALGRCPWMGSAWKSSLKTAKKPRPNWTQTAQDCRRPQPWSSLQSLRILEISRLTKDRSNQSQPVFAVWKVTKVCTVVYKYLCNILTSAFTKLPEIIIGSRVLMWSTMSVTSSPLCSLLLPSHHLPLDSTVIRFQSVHTWNFANFIYYLWSYY